MKNLRARQWMKGLMLVCLLLAGCAFFSHSATEVQAATAGFKTVGGKTYYIKSDGSKQKGWLTLGKYKYYFNKTTGVQVKGWLNVNGQKTYYFTSQKGAMVTGWLTDSRKRKRYFDPKTGKLTRGWMKNSKGEKYYFTSGEGIMATGWLKNSKGQKRNLQQFTISKIPSAERNTIFLPVTVLWLPDLKLLMERNIILKQMVLWLSVQQ